MQSYSSESAPQPRGSAAVPAAAATKSEALFVRAAAGMAALRDASAPHGSIDKFMDFRRRLRGEILAKPLRLLQFCGSEA